MGDTKTTKTLSDSDISTHQRRTGPSGAPAATDVDAHARTDADTAATPEPAPVKDRDA